MGSSPALSLPMPAPTAPPLASLTSYPILSFDVYGTLIEYKPHILTSFQPLLSRLEPTSPFLSTADSSSTHASAGSIEFLKLFQRVEDAIKLERPIKRFDALLREMWMRIAQEIGVHTTEDEAYVFGETISRWPAFPGTVDALKRLATRYKLVALSNIDRFAWDETTVLSGEGAVDWWRVITADDLDTDAEDADTEKLRVLLDTVGKDDRGSGRAELLHVAQSLGHDHAPAKKMGINSVWIVGDGGRWGKEGEWKMVLDKNLVGYGWRFASLHDFADAVDREWEKERC